MNRYFFLLAGAALLVASPDGHGAPFEILQPSLDRWMYPFGDADGQRVSASVFGAVGEADFDDRDGQMLVRFNTSSIVAPGQGAGSYSLSSLQLTLTMTASIGNSLRYDPTVDSFRTYLDPTAPNYVADADAGRPVELFAVGYRNGFSSATFAENSSFGSLTPGTRNAFAAGISSGGAFLDVSNNVAGGFEAIPLSVGQIAGLAPGAVVPLEAEMTFTLNLVDPALVAYYQASLNAGYLEFMVTSLQPTSQMAGSGFPSFYTKEHPFHDPAFGDYVAGQLRGDVTVVPEPTTLALLGGAFGAMLLMRRWRRG